LHERRGLNALCEKNRCMNRRRSMRRIE
jgi:hypothetical protein